MIVDVTPVFPHGKRHDQYTYGQAPWFQDRVHLASQIGKPTQFKINWHSMFVATRRFSNGFVAANGAAPGTPAIKVVLPAGVEYIHLGDNASGATTKGAVSVPARHGVVLLLAKKSVGS